MVKCEPVGDLALLPAINRYTDKSSQSSSSSGNVVKCGTGVRAVVAGRIPSGGDLAGSRPRFLAFTIIWITDNHILAEVFVKKVILVK